MDTVDFTKQMDLFLDRHLCEKNVPGLDCVIYYKRKPLYRHMAGFASVEKRTPITEQTLYHGYSITKLMTCTAGLQLIEQGKLRLEDPVISYIPEFTDLTVLRENGEITPAKNVMTVKDLFCMTAGFNYNLNSAALIKYREETAGACPTNLLPKYLAQQPLDFEPSTRWRYSFCHDVLAVVIERISGMLFSEYMQKHIFDPLGMDDTGFHMTSEKEKRMADKYWYHADTGIRENVGIDISYQFGPEYESGGAGIITSANDYMKFADALCAGDILLKRETTRLMYQDHLSPEVQQQYIKTQHPGFSYGLGVRTIIDQALAESAVGFGDFGWGGAAGAFITMHMEKELTVVYLQHMLGSDIKTLRKTLRNQVYSLLE